MKVLKDIVIIAITCIGVLLCLSSLCLVFGSRYILEYRIFMITVGVSFILSAAICGVKCKRIDLLPDEATLKYLFIINLFFPFVCIWLSAVTKFDFLLLQISMSVYLLFHSCFISVRSKRFQYVIIYLIEFLIMGGFSPAT